MGALLSVWFLVACGDSGSPAFLERYSRSQDPRVITLYFTTGWCDTVGTAKTEETDSTVTVTVPVKAAPHDQPCDSIAPKQQSIRIELRSELGTRTVQGRPSDPVVPEVSAPPAG